VLPCRHGYGRLSAHDGHQGRRSLEALGHPARAKQPSYRHRRAMAERHAEGVDAVLAPWLMVRRKAEVFALERRRLRFAPVRSAAAAFSWRRPCRKGARSRDWPPPLAEHRDEALGAVMGWSAAGLAAPGAAAGG
jgi:hypothetical protein